MTENDFWELIAYSKKESKGDFEQQITILTGELTQKLVEDIAAFDNYLWHFRMIIV